MEQRNHSSGFADLGLGDVPGAGMEYLRAEHELKYRQAIFDVLMKQYDAARLDEAKDAAIIQVVEPAIEPDRQSSPKRALDPCASSVLVGMLARMHLGTDLVVEGTCRSSIPAATSRFEEFRSRSDERPSDSG